MLPMEAVLIRHGYSEQNVAGDRSKQGDQSCFEIPGFRERHSSQVRLTPLGVRQLEAAGAFLRATDPVFDGYLHSDYARAAESAYHLGLPDARWETRPELVERHWGLIDTLPIAERAERFPDWLALKHGHGFYWEPPGGESKYGLRGRLRDELTNYCRRYAGKRIVIVSHGDIMAGFRALLEGWTVEEYAVWDASDDPRDRIHNGQILWYSRFNPERPTERSDSFRWLLSVWPFCPEQSYGTWQRLERRTRRTNEELRAVFERYPRLLPDNLLEEGP